MQLTLETGVPILTVFIQGLLSFFSPCVFPLVPLYVSYLAGGAQSTDEDGNIIYSRKKVLIHTLFFVLGIGFSFFLLGFGFSALGQFFKGNRIWFARISGIIMLFFGLYQLGVFGKSKALEKEHRLSFGLDTMAMNPITALVLGFTFSFAWTPCVGPTLASVLLMAGSASTASTGFFMIGVYIIGFTLPFIGVGLFTGSVLSFFRSHGSIVKYTVKIGAVLLILMGIMTFTGWMNGVTGYLSSVTDKFAGKQEQQIDESKDVESDEKPEEKPTEKPAEDKKPQEKPDRKIIPAPDFVLTDQDGVEHKLSDYRGKTVFLNFWATWCEPCKVELPHIQKVYEEYGENKGDVIILGVANPRTPENRNAADESEEIITRYINANGFTYPTLMDTTGEVFGQYAISSFPTTFMIDKDGNIYGAVTGSLQKDQIKDIIRQTMESGE